MGSHSHSDRRWFLKRGALVSFMIGAVRSLRGQTPTREKLLKVALVAFGAIFFLICPLGLIWPSGWVWVPVTD